MCPHDYRQRFEQALLTFRHQRVWDVRTNDLQPLTPFAADADIRCGQKPLSPPSPAHLAVARLSLLAEDLA